MRTTNANDNNIVQNRQWRAFTCEIEWMHNTCMSDIKKFVVSVAINQNDNKIQA